MPPLKKTGKKIIPNSIRKFRAKNWKSLQREEQRRGDSLKRSLKIKRIAERFKQQKASGTMTREKLRAQAKGIALSLTMLVDDYLKAKRKQNTPAAEWNKTYLDFLQTFSREIPKELLKEIYRQIRKE